MSKIDRSELWNSKGQDDLDKVVRKRLENWASWQKSIQKPAPTGYPNPQPMFREYKPEWVEEDTGSRRNQIAANVDDAEKVEAIICMLPKHSQSVLHRYFVKDQNSVESARGARVSVRKFERWLSQAIGQVAQLMLLEASEKKRKIA